VERDAQQLVERAREMVLDSAFTASQCHAVAESACRADGDAGREETRFRDGRSAEAALVRANGGDGSSTFRRDEQPRRAAARKAQERLSS
jgi:hypothetical protein